VKVFGPVKVPLRVYVSLQVPVSVFVYVNEPEGHIAALEPGRLDPGCFGVGLTEVAPARIVKLVMLTSTVGPKRAVLQHRYVNEPPSRTVGVQIPAALQAVEPASSGSGISLSF
jgi:hypothetical protein